MASLELRRDSRVMTGNSGRLSCCPREVRSPFELRGGAGHCSRVTAGQIDLIYACVQKVHVPLQCQQGSRGCIHGLPGESGLVSSGSQQFHFLSSCNGDLLEPIEWTKGSQASYGVLREDSGLLSRPCRKRRASSRDDGGI